jgi:hypothetical protein
MDQRRTLYRWSFVVRPSFVVSYTPRHPFTRMRKTSRTMRQVSRTGSIRLSASKYQLIGTATTR